MTHSDYSPLQPLWTEPVGEGTQLTIKSLMAASVHLGHAPSAWHPNNLSTLYGTRDGIHIINLEHTLVHLRRALNVAREIARTGGNILFIGSKRSVQRIAVKAAQQSNSFFVTRWVGGTITNKERVLRRSVGFDPDKVLQDPLEGEEEVKEQPPVATPDLLIVLDMPNNLWAIREANVAHVPVVAIVDTDCDPSLVPYPIPANDDASTSVELIAGLLSRAIREGKNQVSQ